MDKRKDQFMVDEQVEGWAGPEVDGWVDKELRGWVDAYVGDFKNGEFLLHLEWISNEVLPYSKEAIASLL